MYSSRTYSMNRRHGDMVDDHPGARSGSYARAVMWFGERKKRRATTTKTAARCENLGAEFHGIERAKQRREGKFEA